MAFMLPVGHETRRGQVTIFCAPGSCSALPLLLYSLQIGLILEEATIFP
jgi:hypothetical protein